MRGDLHIDERNVTSNLMIKTGRKELIKGKLELLDNTGKLMKIDTNLDFSYPGRDIMVHHTFQQNPTLEQKYESILAFQTENGQVNNILSWVERKDDNIFISSDINLSGQLPSNIHGQYALTPEVFVAKLEYNKHTSNSGSQKYSVFVDSTAKEESVNFGLGVDVPAVGGALTFAVKAPSSIMSARSDMQWRVGTEQPQNMFAEVWIEPPSADRLNGSVTVSYPSRTLIFNAHHILGSKYITHADFQWDTEKKINVDTSVQVDGDRFIGTAAVQSPKFKFFPSNLQVTVTHDSSREEYNTKADVVWDGERITVNPVIKKPIDLKTFVATLDVASTIKVIKKMKLLVDHKMSASVGSMARLTWNKQFYETEVMYQKIEKGSRKNFEGIVKFSSSQRYMKKGQLRIWHEIAGNTFNSGVSFLRNKKEYKLDSSISSRPLPDGYENTGSVTVSYLKRKVVTSWNHLHLTGMINSVLNMVWDGEKLSAELKGDFINGIGTSLNINIPLYRSKAVLDHSFTLKNNLDFMDGNINLRLGESVLMNMEAGFSAGDNFTTTFLAEMPDLGVNTVIKLDAYNSFGGKRSGDVQYGASLMAALTPETVMTLDILKEIDLIRGSQFSITWTSTIQGYESFRYVFDVNLLPGTDALGTVTTIETLSKKLIKVETLLSIDTKLKESKFKLTTPYDFLREMRVDLTYSGDPEAFTSTGMLSIQPYLEPTSALVTWNAKLGLQSKLRLTIPKVPNILVEANFDEGFKSGNGRLELENKNSQVYGIFGQYQVEQGFSGTITVSVPGRRDIVIDIKHTEETYGFSTNAHIRHNRKNNFQADIKFALENRLSFSARSSLQTQLLSEMEQIEASINVDGTLAKFSVDGLFDTNNLEESAVHLFYDSTNEISGKLLAKSPLTKPFEVSFSHTDSPSTFETKADITLDGNSVLDGFAMMTNDDVSLVGEVKLKTFATEDFSFLSRTNWERKTMITKNDISYGEKEVGTEWISKISDLYLHEALTVKVTGYDDVVVEINHNGDLKQLRSDIELKNGQEKHKAAISFSNNESAQVACNFTLDSPRMPPVTAGFYVQSASENFQSHAEVTVSEHKSEVNFNLALAPTRKAVSFEVKSLNTPEISASFSHNGSFPNSISRLGISLPDSNNFDLKLEISNDKSPLIDVELVTPFDKFSSFEAELSYEENKARLNFECTTNGEKSGVDFAVVGSPDNFNIHALLFCPYISTVNVMYEHESAPNSFRCHAEYAAGSEQSFIDLSHSHSDHTETKLSLNTEFFEPVDVTFSHFQSDDLNRFVNKVSSGSDSYDTELVLDKKTKKVSLTMENGWEKLIDLTLTYNLGNPMVDFKLSSLKPHPLTANCYIQATLPDIKLQWNLIHASEPLSSGDVEYTVLLKPLFVRGKAIIKAKDFDGFLTTIVNPADGAFEAGAKANIGNDNWSFKMKSDVSSNIQGKVEIQMPNTDPIYARLTHATIKSARQGILPTIDSFAEIRIDGKVFSVSAEMSQNQGVLTLRSPFEKIKDIKLTYYGKGDLSQFQYRGSLRYRVGEEIRMTLDHVHRPAITKSRVTFTSPFTEEITSSIEHTESATDFRISCEFTNGADNTINSTTVFERSPKSITFSSKLKTLLFGETFEQLAELKHNGDLDNFSTVLLLKSQEDKIQVNASFQKNPSVEGKVTIVTPFEDLENLKLSFSQSGGSNNILSTAELQYAPGKIISGNVDIFQNGWQHIIASAEMHTPFEKFKVNSISYTHKAGDRRLTGNADLSIMGKDIKGDFAASMTPLAFSLTVTTPFKNFDQIAAKFYSVFIEQNEKLVLEIRTNQENRAMMQMTSWSSDIDILVEVNSQFESFANEVVEFKWNRGRKMSELRIKHNWQLVLDGDLKYGLTGDHKTMIATFRAPILMAYSIDGDFTQKHVDMNVDLNWNQDEPNSRLSLEAGYDVRFNDKSMKLKLSDSELLWSMDALKNEKQNKMNIVWGTERNEMVGYDIIRQGNSQKVKLILPSRTLEMTSFRRGREVSGTFAWNADEDKTQKIEFKTVKRPGNGIMEADFNIIVQVGLFSTSSPLYHEFQLMHKYFLCSLGEGI